MNGYFVTLRVHTHAYCPIIYYLSIRSVVKYRVCTKYQWQYSNFSSLDRIYQPKCLNRATHNWARLKFAEEDFDLLVSHVEGVLLVQNEVLLVLELPPQVTNHLLTHLPAHFPILIGTQIETLILSWNLKKCQTD